MDLNEFKIMRQTVAETVFHAYCYRICISIVMILTLTLVLFLFTNQSKAQENNSEDINVFLPVLFREYDPRWSWLEPYSITLSPQPSDPVFMLIDHDGRVHLLWSTLFSPRFIYHTYLENNSWTAIQPISPTLGTSYTVHHPIITADGAIHIVWRTWLGSGTDLPYRLMYTSFSGGHWLPEEEIARSDYYELNGKLHTDSYGRIRVTYVDSTFIFPTHAYQRSRTNSGWTTPIEIPQPSFTQITWPDMVGGIHFYGTQYPDTLYYSYWLNGDFLVKDHQLEGNISTRDSQMDFATNLHTYWISQVPVPGGTVRGVNHQILDKHQKWGPLTIPSGENNVAGNVSQSWDSASLLALAWEHSEDEQLGFAFWDNGVQILNKHINYKPAQYWELRATAISRSQGMFCTLVRLMFSSDFEVLCAEVSGL
jgi:hypothetical protein